MSVFVFVGPTIEVSEAAQHLDATFLPPACQGDVFRVASQQPRALGIIDGYFDQVAAVWHKEILWAVSAGIAVFGAASMGALRACELAPFGMVGVGKIFRAFHEGELEDDDEVAIAHLAQEHAFRPVSEAMVNIRATLVAAEAAGVITPEFAAAAVSRAKRLPYPERIWTQLLGEGGTALDPALVARLKEWLLTGRIDQKRLDAIAMLRAMKHLLSQNWRPDPPNFAFEYTNAWDVAVARWRAPLPED